MTLNQLYGPIQAELEEVERLLARELADHPPPIRDVVDSVADYHGKRIRPALVLLAGKAVAGTGPGHLHLATTIELIHTATLIHDDILDEASIRRGLPTLCTRWGTEISVLLGDYILSRAFSVLAQFDGQACFPVLARTAHRMCEGELTQTRSRFDMELSESAYLQIVEKKTASLFAAAAQLGARLAGAPDDQADTFRRFGLNLGMAFQITDDCLDIVGREDIVGKSLGTDLGKGKLTLPVIRLLQRLSAEEREDVCRLARDGFPEHRRPPFRERIRSHGAIESALATARSFIVDAVALLNSVPHSPAQRSLSGLGDYVIARSS